MIQARLLGTVCLSGILYLGVLTLYYHASFYSKKLKHTKTMTVAYLRVSTSHQHIENQKGEITRYANNKGIVIDRWEKEVVSGKTNRGNRKLGLLIKSLKKGNTLVVTEISRLSRSLHEIMQIMKHCINHEITIHSTKDGYTFDDSINSKVLSFAFGLSAEIEHKLISQRTQEAMAIRKAEGKHMGRKKGSNVKIQCLEKRKNDIIMWLKEGRRINDICSELKVSYNTFYRFRQEHPEVVPK